MTPLWHQEASDLIYFHGYLQDQAQVDRLAMLADTFFQNVRGVYFLRPSLTDRRALTLTVVEDLKNILHFRVTIDSHRKYVCCNGQHGSFTQIINLVDYHTRHSFMEHDRALPNLTLTSPLLRRDIKDNMYRYILCGDDVCPPFHGASKKPSTQTTRYEVTFQPGNSDGPPSAFVNVIRLPDNPNSGLGPSTSQLLTAPPGPPHGPAGTQTVGSDPSRRQKQPPPVASTVPICEETHVYSEPTPDYIDRTSELIDGLRREELQICECGILLTECVMPLNWTMHKDRRTGKVFFQNSSGRTTWKLPDNAQSLLSEFQKSMIEKYTLRN